MSRPTRYQRTHHPVRTVEVLCTSRAPLTDRNLCPDCGRRLRRGGRDHKPNVTGSLGWIDYYADGSTRLRAPVSR